MTHKAFADFLAGVPESPGVYQFKDAQGRVLYVGKAISLKKRLRSYPTGSSSKQVFLVSRAERVETIVTRSELEALILEQTLIQKERPPYNVIWKDNKSYPYLELTAADEFPRLYFTRRSRHKGSAYFGPYMASTARRLQRLVNQFFRIPSCRAELDGKQTPCLYHHLNWCDAPCAGAITRDRYAGLVTQVRMFLGGGAGKLVRELKEAMESAAAREDFESAAKIRDRLAAIEQARQEQAVVAPDDEDVYVLGLARSGTFACIAMLTVNEGKLISKQDFTVRRAAGETDADLVASFIGQHLSEVHLPPRIFLPGKLESQELVQNWLSERADRPVTLHVPVRGRGRELMDIARANAQATLISRGRVGEDEALAQLKAVAEALELPRSPGYIEAVDLSRLKRDEAVGATVVFRDGLPVPSQYRRYLIKTAPGDDDYACMRETVSRRLMRLKKGKGGYPDLMLLDGGAAHLKETERAVKELGISGIRLAALAKREEELHLPGRPDPLRLPEDSPALNVLRRVRDEAHRYVNAYHRQRRAMAQRAAAKALKRMTPR